MLSIQTVNSDSLELLKAISAQPEMRDLRLVGGTALALQYGHRQSVDLDFFGPLPAEKDALIDVARRVGSVMVLNQSKIILQKDIAAMKVNAIIGRGTRKDFIDLYVLLLHYSLAEILGFYEQKYPEFSEYRALMSMTYFDDAELQDMPLMFIDTPWDEMKKAIIQAVNAYQQ